MGASLWRRKKTSLWVSLSPKLWLSFGCRKKNATPKRGASSKKRRAILIFAWLPRPTQPRAPHSPHRRTERRIAARPCMPQRSPRSLGSPKVGRAKWEDWSFGPFRPLRACRWSFRFRCSGKVKRGSWWSLVGDADANQHLFARTNMCFVQLKSA